MKRMFLAALESLLWDKLHNIFFPLSLQCFTHCFNPWICIRLIILNSIFLSVTSLNILIGFSWEWQALHFWEVLNSLTIIMVTLLARALNIFFLGIGAESLAREENLHHHCYKNWLVFIILQKVIKDICVNKLLSHLVRIPSQWGLSLKKISV